MEKLEVFLLVLLIILLTALTLLLIKKQQNKLTFIHPGWIIVIVNCFYGLMVPIAFLIYGDNLYIVYSDIFDHFDSGSFIKVIKMYAVLSVGFLYSQGLITIINNVLNSAEPKIHKKTVRLRPVKEKLLSTLIMLLPIVGAYIIYIRFASVGGFISAISLSRRDLAGAIAESVIFARYEFFFQGFFILYFALISRKQFKKKSQSVGFVLMLSLYIIYLLLIGIRLQIIVLIIGLIFILYSSTLGIVLKNKSRVIISEFWIKNKRKVIAFGLLIFIFFNWYTFQRVGIRLTLVGEKFDITSVEPAELLFPKEFSTGYVPGLLMLNNSWNDLGSVYYWQKFVPSSVLTFVGVEPSNTVAKNLAWSLHGVGRSAVYTITLPVDIYSSTNSYFMIFLIGSILYLVLWRIICLLSKRGYWGICFSALIFLNLFYVVRVEAANWFPRIWQGGLVLVIVWAIYSVLSRIKLKE